MRFRTSNAWVGLLGLCAACRVNYDSVAAGDDAAVGDGAATDLVQPPPGDGVASCTTAPPGCALGAVGARCYTVCPPATWIEGRDTCAAWGGCLVTIDDATENAALSAWMLSLVPRPDSNPWIGYRQPAGSPEPDGGWAWECGASSYVNWDSNEPGDTGPNGEDSATFVINTSFWEDLNGSLVARSSLCER